MLENVIIIILAAILMVVLALVGVAMIELLKKLNKKYNLQIEEEVFARIEDTITTIVLRTTQKIVDELKENGNGKLTDEQKEQIFNDVKNLTLSALDSTQTMAIINRFGSLDDGLEFIIEATIGLNKKSYLTSTLSEVIEE